MIDSTASEWLRVAVPLVLRQDLSTSPTLALTVVNDESAAYQNGATGVLRTVVEKRSGRVHAQATLTDLDTQRSRTVIDADAPAGQTLALLNELARKLDSHAIAFSTNTEAALQAYVDAVSTTDAAKRIEGLTRAMAADANFGLAYLSLIETLSQTQVREAQAVLAKAASRRTGFIPLDQARFDAIGARLAHAPLADQIRANDVLVRVTPNDPEILATLGSELFLAGEGARGESLFRKAIELNPSNANLRRQFALGLIEAKQFRPAESVLSSLPQDAGVIPELATCALLEGDPARATSIYNRFLSARQAANDPSIALLRANWLSIAEPLDQAISWLAAQKFASPDLQSLALSQQAIWELAEGRLHEAQQNVVRATHESASPLAKLYAAAAQLNASERTNAGGVQLDKGATSVVNAYGLFFAQQYAAAAEAWRELDQKSGDTDLRARAMLASSLGRAGRRSNAAAVKVLPFVPGITGSDPYAAISFREMRRLLKL